MKRSTAGFSLIELLTVIFILGLLASILYATFLNQRVKAKYAAVKLSLDAIATEAEEYRHEHGTYPPDANPGVPPVDARGHQIFANFRTAPNTPFGERWDWDSFPDKCVAKILSYGPEDRRDDDYRVAGGERGAITETGDDRAKVVQAECESP